MAVSAPAQQIHVLAGEDGDCEQARRLARRLGLPLISRPCPGQLLLRLGSSGLELLKVDDPMLGRGVRAEFVHGRIGYRRTRQQRELICKAMGVVSGRGAWVVDTTGGLGRDSFLLASAGCRVDTCEDHPVIACLLADGLARALACPETRAIAERICLHPEDGVEFLHRLERKGSHPDVVYLDPMFPAKKKRALVKKELQMLQMVTDSSRTGEELLSAAHCCAPGRIVVKRPLQAAWLGDRHPSWSIRGTTIRFDVYQLHP